MTNNDDLSIKCLARLKTAKNITEEIKSDDSLQEQENLEKFQINTEEEG